MAIPDPTQFNRARDTFAGYNVLAIAMRVPVAMIRGSGNVIGLDALAQRRTGDQNTNPFRTIDREGNPGVNVALVPFNRKNEYNAAHHTGRRHGSIRRRHRGDASGAGH